MNFKERLFELLNENDLWFAELSRKTGISKTRISSYISGISYPSAQNLIILSDFFHLSSDYLLGLSNEKKSGVYAPADLSNFYSRYKRLLVETNKSNRLLAKNADIDKSCSFLWSKGKIPQTNILIKLANIFGCTVDYLLGRSKKEQNEQF